MSLEIWRNGHLTEEGVEEYAFGRLSEGEAAAAEEHYLMCDNCQEALEEGESYIRTIRSAFATHARVAAIEGKVRASAWDFGRRGRNAAATAVAGAALAMVVFVWTGWRSQEPVTVELASFRGASGATITRAPALRPLDLSIGAARLSQAGGLFRIEVVNASGGRMWEGPAARAEGRLVVRVPRKMEAGAYWVRLYDSGGGLLEEFGLRLE